jgi:hypothetical protein
MSGECEECSQKKRLSLQTKLEISEPGDPYEQEADRIADQVLARPAHPTTGGAPAHIQRFSAQPARQAAASPVSVDQVLASSGRPLEPALRQDMERRFGYDFSRVRVHTGAVAEQSAGEVNAHAYTVGHNLVFAAGRFAPGTHDGRRLLAHELTHVVQQSGADTVRVRQSNDARGLTIGRHPTAPFSADRNVSLGLLQRDSPESDPAWLSASSQEPLPGVPAPDYDSPRYLRPWVPVPLPPMGDAHIYTKADKDNLRKALVERERQNRENLAQFLDDYVEAAVQISGAFVAAEMSSTAKAAGKGRFAKLLEVALSATAAAILTGGVGVFAGKLGKGAIFALKLLARTGTGIASGAIRSADDNALLGEELDKRQATLNTITLTLGKNTGKFVKEMILAMEGDVNRGFWLGEADLHELWKFRIPELFPPAKREGIRSVVAGVLAGLTHTGECRTRIKCWGLQCACDTYDRHEIIVQLTPAERSANVRQVQINSSSQVLSGELAGASIRMLPTMALYIMVDQSATSDKAAGKLMNACRSPFRAGLDEIVEFAKAYDAEPASKSEGPGTNDPFLRGSPLRGKMLITRAPNENITVSPSGLTEAIWLYQWATGDDNLGQLAKELVEWHQEEQEKEMPEESKMASPTGLAKLAHWRLTNFGVDGARKLISDFVGNLVPQPPTGARTKGRPIDPREERP